jgi:hypothetical protein
VRHGLLIRETFGLDKGAIGGRATR